jgi:hypothetical protein
MGLYLSLASHLRHLLTSNWPNDMRIWTQGLAKLWTGVIGLGLCHAEKESPWKTPEPLMATFWKQGKLEMTWFLVELDHRFELWCLLFALMHFFSVALMAERSKSEHVLEEGHTIQSLRI